MENHCKPKYLFEIANGFIQPICEVNLIQIQFSRFGVIFICVLVQNTLPKGFSSPRIEFVLFFFGQKRWRQPRKLAFSILYTRAALIVAFAKFYYMSRIDCYCAHKTDDGPLLYGCSVRAPLTDDDTRFAAPSEHFSMSYIFLAAIQLSCIKREYVAAKDQL